MPLNIRSETVNELAQQPAARRQVSKTEAVRMALESELRRADDAIPLWQRTRSLRDRISAYPDTGLPADKEFFDELNGEL